MAQRRAFLDAVAIPPGMKQSLLHRVLGVRQGAEHAVTVDQQFATMTLDIATELFHCVCASVPATPTDRRRALLDRFRQHCDVFILQWIGWLERLVVRWTWRKSRHFPKR